MSQTKINKNRLRNTFVETVNFKEPDANGNVLITQVATAENLVSPDNINDTAYILFRTAGGTKSISDGPATLMKIAGNVINPRRSPNDIETEHSETQRVTATVDATLFGALSFVNNTSGTYTLSCNDVNDEPTWQYDDNGTLIDVNLEVAGITLSSTAFVGDTMEIVYNYSDVEGEESYATATYNAVDRLTIAVDETTFAQKVNETFGVYTFLRQGNIWMINDSEVNISEYGITITGTTQTGDTITVTYNGDMQVATPTSFQASGFNQFNPANVLPGYNTINEDGEIVVSDTESYVAYIHAVGGLENNYGNRHGDYTIYDDNTTGTLVRVGYSATIPTTSSTVTLSGSDGIEVVNKSTIPNPPADMLSAERLQWITFPKDGYICVALTDITKLCVHPTWSNYKDDVYAEYVAPSVIDIPTKGILIDDASHTMVDLPTYLAKVGNVYDEILFEDHRYQKRIDYLPYTEENLTIVQNKGVDYIYDSEAIYFVAEQPLTYIINFEVDEQGNPVIDESGNVKLNNVNGQYIANDFGTEEFVGTTVAVLANTLYGNNLVDKLRTDVLTKSAQSLSQEQKEQVWKNLGTLPLYNYSKTIQSNALLVIALEEVYTFYDLKPETNITSITIDDSQLLEKENAWYTFYLHVNMDNPTTTVYDIDWNSNPNITWGNTSPTMTAGCHYLFSFTKPKGSSVWVGNQCYTWME